MNCRLSPPSHRPPTETPGASFDNHFFSFPLLPSPTPPSAPHHVRQIRLFRFPPSPCIGDGHTTTRAAPPPSPHHQHAPVKPPSWYKLLILMGNTIWPCGHFITTWRNTIQRSYCCQAYDCDQLGGSACSMSPLDTLQGDKKSKCHKQKPHQLHEQSFKHVQALSTSIAGEDSFLIFHSHFLFLPLDEHLQFLPQFLEGALQIHIPRSDPMESRNKAVQSASHLTRPPDYSEAPWNLQEGYAIVPWRGGLLLKLRRDKIRPW